MSDHPIVGNRRGSNNPNWRGGSSKETKRKNGLIYKERHRKEINAKRRAEYKANPEPVRARTALRRVTHRAEVLEWNRLWLIAYRARLRKEMIAAFGGKCVCCGEDESRFLQLDHIYNDGAADRVINKTAAKLWAFLKRNGWPKDRHQLLCANCNFGKLMNGGTCPHLMICQ